MRPESLRSAIARDLRSNAKPEGYPKLQAYLGSPYPALGLSVPKMRELMRSRRVVFTQMTTAEVNALAELLWKGETFEEKACAISLLELSTRQLDDETWSMTDRWIEQAVGWGLCDDLGSGPISDMLYREPGRFREVMGWTRSPNQWRRRISTYALRNFVSSGELDRPFELLERLLYDEEFWVQRAVGTWLRECWKKDRRRTEAFLQEHVRGLPRVVITVATERAPKVFRESLRRRRSP